MLISESDYLQVFFNENCRVIANLDLSGYSLIEIIEFFDREIGSNFSKKLEDGATCFCFMDSEYSDDYFRRIRKR